MPPRLGKDGLTGVDRRVMKGALEGKSVTEIGVKEKLGKTREAARVAASTILRKPTVKSAIEKALDAAGATIAKSAEVIAEAHAAEKTASTKTGEVIELGPDHATRLKAAELNGKFRKLVGTAPEEGGQVIGIGFFIAKGFADRGIA